MDPFDRQKRIDGWKQDLIENAIAVCFGVGGLGSVVAINLCRLGVGKIILIDKDVVDLHNLNRQLLFSLTDVGRDKVIAAKESLDRNHNIRSSIEEFKIDIVEN